MKRKLLNLIVTLCMVPLLVTPVQAAEEEIISFLETGKDVAETEEVFSLTETDWTNKEAQLYHVTDTVGLLTEKQRSNLEMKARALAEQYNLGIYAVVVDDYYNYASGSVQDAAEAIYKKYSLGVGTEKNGVLLLLSMGDRDYSLIAHGINGNYAFNDEGRTYLIKYFLDDFAENDWYTGLEDYITWSGNYLEAAEQGEPYSYRNIPMSASEKAAAIGIRVLIIFLAPLLIAAIYIASLTAKMKSIEQATKAVAYVSGNIKMKKEIDKFIHATETRTKISKDSGSKSGSRSSGSGGFSGTSGKF